MDAQMFEIVAFLVFGAMGVLADRYSSRRRNQPQTLGDAIFTYICVGLAYSFCAGVGKRIFQSTSRRRAELRLARLRQRFPIAGKWPDRGWLVMLRARDRGALAEPPRCLSRLELCCWHRRAGIRLRDSVVLGDAAATGGVGESALGVDLGPCEEGLRSGLEFTITVVRVVEMEEEGLFRNIVGYL